MTALDGLVREYRQLHTELAEAEADGPRWSPIAAERFDKAADRVAREIADLVAGFGSAERTRGAVAAVRAFVPVDAC